MTPSERLAELTKRAERGVYLASQIAELEKMQPSKLDKVRWFNSGGTIDDSVQSEIVSRGYISVLTAFRRELEALLGSDQKGETDDHTQ